MDQHPLILHHYDLSPFSEKIRVMLGYTGLDWLSVKTSEMPPRPGLAPLAGGYRRIPVAQSGSDVFCDTRTITAEIARRSGRAELALEGCGQPVRDFVRDVDLTIFLACVMSTIGPGFNRKAAGGLSLWKTLRLIWDRLLMAAGARTRGVSPKNARRHVRTHLERLEQMLEQDFLFGDRPNIGDFAAYHGLWFVRKLTCRHELEAFPRVTAWMDRIAAFGHGNPREIRPEEALEIARESEPETVDAGNDDPNVGKEVSICPDDYGRIPVTGELVSQTDSGWIVRRETPETGVVHVHFPRQGFVMSER